MAVTSTPKSFSTKIVNYWLPVAAMLGVMYYFSTDVFSGENTRGIVETVMGWIAPHASQHTMARVHHFVRKGAHVAEYAMLAALLFRAFKADSRWAWRLRWFIYSLGIVVAWALLDELHQSFTRRRGGSIYDSALDTSGGLFALFVIWLLSPRKKQRP